jgi:hypothetical protein
MSGSQGSGALLTLLDTRYVYPFDWSRSAGPVRKFCSGGCGGAHAGRARAQGGGWVGGWALGGGVKEESAGGALGGGGGACERAPACQCAPGQGSLRAACARVALRRAVCAAPLLQQPLWRPGPSALPCHADSYKLNPFFDPGKCKALLPDAYTVGGLRAAGPGWLLALALARPASAGRGSCCSTSY